MPDNESDNNSFRRETLNFLRVQKRRTERYLSFLRKLGYVAPGKFGSLLEDIDGLDVTWTLKGIAISDPVITGRYEFRLSVGSDRRNMSAIAARLGYSSLSFAYLQRWFCRGPMPPDSLFFRQLLNENAFPVATQFHDDYLRPSVAQSMYLLDKHGIAVIDADWYVCTFYDSWEAVIDSVVLGKKSHFEEIVLDVEEINGIKKDVGILNWH